jgi:hypothetical protein
MAILYDVPRIGEKRGDFGQQGPTCWYYAAKMLLRFHGLTQPGSEIYKELRELHQVRRILTEFRFDTKTETKAELDKRKAFLDRVPGIIRLLESKGTLSKEQAQQLANLKEKLESRKEIRNAIESLDKCVGNGLDRLELLTNFVPTAGFTKIERKFWSGEDKLEDILKHWGPIYTGGSVSSLATKRTDTGEKTKSGDRVLQVSEFKVPSSHAIVLAGVRGNTVYYKDPNHTDELRTIDRSVFYRNLDEDPDDFMIGIYCGAGMKDMNGYMQCIHMQRKVASFA